MQIPPQAFLVFAGSKWNASGQRLEVGRRCRIEASKDAYLVQEWQDSYVTYGAEGWAANLGKFSSDLLNGLLRIRQVNGETQRYFALMGCIGTELKRAFLIGAGCEITPTVGGELFAFANDAEHAHGNNHGQLVVIITEI